jgi:hypothetical protein
MASDASELGTTDAQQSELLFGEIAFVSILTTN